MSQQVIYKCRCMSQEVTISVTDRFPKEDVVHWVQMTVGLAIQADHDARSPMCQAQEMEYCKLPIDSRAPMLGGKPVLDSCAVLDKGIDG